MPSFTRRVPSTTLPPPPGTHPSPSVSSLHLLPTGLPSLDDLLGGGLPLGSVLLVLAPDSQSAWGRLVERYWIAQGLISGQGSVVVAADEEMGRELVGGCMWAEGGAGSGAGEESQSEGEMDEGGANAEAKKIAWRYEKMAKFKTTVGGNGSNLSLLQTIPAQVLTAVHQTNQQSYVTVSPTDQSTGSGSGASSSSGKPSSSAYTGMARGLVGLNEKLVQADQKRATRVTVHELGSFDWGSDVSEQHIHRFLHSLRSLLRTKSASALVTIPHHLIAGPGKEAFIRKLAWGVDACVELKGFADDPTLPPLFPTTHGLLTLHSYPTTHTLLPSTLKHSTLLGVSQTADGGAGGGGAGENNLGFRLKRKRFTVETVHLGVEGGVGERATGPVDVVGALAGTLSGTSATQSEGLVGGVESPVDGSSAAGPNPKLDTNAPDRPVGPHGDKEKKPSKPRARVRFGGEEEMTVTVSVEGEKADPHTHTHGHGHDHDHQHDRDLGAARPGGNTHRVPLRHDRPDLYEF